jgi:hypothetical protein
MATPSPQDFLRYSSGNDRRKTFQVVRLEKRSVHVRGTSSQGSEQHDGSITKTQLVAPMTPSGDPSAQPMQCAICTASNPPSAKFCNECGSPLSLCICPQCQVIYARTAKACIACGTATEDALATPKANAAAAAAPPSTVSTVPAADSPPPIETIEKDWKALLQEGEKQVERQVEEGVHRQVERQVQIEPQVDGHRDTPMAQQEPERAPRRLARWPAMRLHQRRDVPTRAVARDARHPLRALSSWSAIVAGTCVLVCLLVAPPRPRLAVDYASKKATGNGIAPAGEATKGAQSFAEGKIIRESAAAKVTAPSDTGPPIAEAEGVSAAPPEGVTAPSGTGPPIAEAEGASAAPPEDVSARATTSRSSTADVALSRVKQKALSAVAERHAPKASRKAWPIRAASPTSALARVAIAKPPAAKTGQAAGRSANRVEAPVQKPEPPRTSASEPCSTASETQMPCDANTAAAANARTTSPQTATASPASLQPEHAAKVPPASADSVASTPASGLATPPTVQPAPASAP